MIYQMKPEPWEMLAQNNTTEEDAIAALQALNLTPINSPEGLSFISDAECGWTAFPQKWRDSQGEIKLSALMQKKF